MLDITKHKSYNLKLPQFLCDYPLKKDVPTPFDLMLDGFRFIVFSAKPGYGKTSMLVSCLLDSRIMRKTFNNVLLCIPETSRNSLAKNPFKGHDPSKIYDDLDHLDQIFKQITYNASQGETTLLVIDDLQSSLKRVDVANTLNHIIANMRHLRISVVICVQNYNHLSLSSRKLINILVTWKPSVKEWEVISDEMLDFSDEEKKEIYDYSFKRDNADGHAWLLIDTKSGRLFSMYDELKTKHDV